MCSVLPINIFSMKSSQKGPECGMKPEEHTQQEKTRPDHSPDQQRESKKAESIPEICVTTPPREADEHDDDANQSLDSSLLNNSSDSCVCEQHCCSPTGVAQLVVPSYSGPSYPDHKVETLKPWQCARSKQQRRANCRRMKLINKCDCRLDPMV